MDSPCMLVHNALPRNFGDTTWEYSRNTLEVPSMGVEISKGGEYPSG
jgi:hypothetical protein